MLKSADAAFAPYDLKDYDIENSKIQPDGAEFSEWFLEESIKEIEKE